MANAAAQATPPMAPKPAHVPDALVYDFDLFTDPGLLADPHTRILEMHEKAPPIFWTPRNGGRWVFLGHEANFEASRDWEHFTNQMVPIDAIKQIEAAQPPGSPHIPIAVPICLDPPDHTKYRMPLNAVFSPKNMSNLKGEVRELAKQLIAEIAPKGRCEFMSAVAEPLPVKIFLKIMGLPLERMPEFRALVREHLESLATTLEENIRRSQKITASMRDVFIDRRDNPKDDLISLLWKTQIDGKPLTMDDMENYGVLLFIGGLDTVMNGMGFGVRHLARNLDLQDRLRAHPELASEVSEEMLRRYTFTVPPRVVAKDQVFLGVEMKRGELVNLFLPGADLDPKHFPDPGKYDLNREDKVHIAFNSGPHRCLGSHLARVELQTLYEEMVAGLPQFRLDPEKPAVFHGGHVIGLDELHLVWDV